MPAARFELAAHVNACQPTSQQNKNPSPRQADATRNKAAILTTALTALIEGEWICLQSPNALDKQCMAAWLDTFCIPCVHQRPVVKVYWTSGDLAQWWLRNLGWPDRHHAHKGRPRSSGGRRRPGRFWQADLVHGSEAEASGLPTRSVSIPCVCLFVCLFVCTFSKLLQAISKSD